MGMAHPLKKWRLDAGLTLQQAAERIDRSPMTFHRFENGERIPDKETMPVVCEKTGLQPNDFYPSASSMKTKRKGGAPP